MNVVADTFWTNPQYRAQVCDADEGDADNTGTIIVGLMQKERRKKRSQGLDLLTLGYSIYKVKDGVIASFLLLFLKCNLEDSSLSGVASDTLIPLFVTDGEDFYTGFQI